MVLQEDGIPSTSTYLRYLYTLPHLEHLTVCFRLHLLQARQEILVLSYAHQNYDNELYIGKEEEVVVVVEEVVVEVEVVVVVECNVF